MFSLHETTKIRLCRAAFVALCIVPVCLVVAWCVVVRLDSYRAWHERSIAALLGWQTRLGGVATPRPGVLLYRDLELADPNNGQLLARLPYVELESTGTATNVRFPFPAMLNGARLDEFWSACRELARGTAESRVRFEARNLTLHLSGGEETFVDLSGQIDGSEGHATGRLTFCRAQASGTASKPCELVVTRRTHAGLPVHSVDLSSGETPLPAGLIAAVWPSVEQLGRQCSFTGRLLAVEQSGAWRTELQGQLNDVELDLVMRPFRHRLSGLAQAQLDRVVVVGGRLEAATGSLHAGPGVISRSLVQSAETHLHVRATDFAVSGADNLLPYELLCAGFEMGPHGMTIRGAVPQTRGALLVDERRVLVQEPPVIRQPVVDLVRTLVPQSEVQVPATRETVVLTSTLPVPAIMPEPGHEEPLPTARPLSVTPRPTGNTFRR